MISTAITSTGMRQTQNLAAPPTQNTAPVLEFRCLYTSDLRRKQKRWQDGYLRFHTFNKRIMVYEAPSRNFIGDQHWRENGTVQDGDELELDRPVIVQVGEAVGRMDQDLTELLEKRRKPQDVIPEDAVSSPRREPINTPFATNPPRPIVGQPSQLRPKSLNALLGNPKGPVRRASLPIKSPHELRNENGNSSWEDGRPAKRQRVESRVDVSSRPTVKPKSQTRTHTNVPIECNEDTQRPKATFRIPIDLQPRKDVSKKSSDPTPISKSVHSSNEQHLEVEAPRIQNAVSVRTLSEDPSNVTGSGERQKGSGGAKSRAESKGGQARRHTNDSEKTLDRHSKCPTINFRRTKSATEAMQIVSDEEAASTGKPRKERMKLQMASRKPRKKLIYRDLLPQVQPPAKCSSSGESTIIRKSRERSTSSRPPKRAEYSLVDFHEEVQHQLADRLSGYHGRANIQSDDYGETPAEKPKSQRLLVSQDESSLSPASHHRTKAKPPKSGDSINRGHDTADSLNYSRSLQSAETLIRNIPKAPSTVHDTALTLSKMDEILFSQRRSSHPANQYTPEPEIIPISSQELSSSSLPTTPPRSVSHSDPPRKSPLTTLVPSSPGFQTQSHKSPRKGISPARSSPKMPLPEIRISKSTSPKSRSSIAPPSEVSPSKLPSPKAFTPKAPSPIASPPKEYIPEIPSPEPLPPKPPSPKTTAPKPLFPKPPTSPEGHLTIAQKPLPAFQAPRPKARSPLKKAVSDTTTMRPPPALPVSRVEKATTAVAEGERRVQNSDLNPWSKEAWDLFGCGRDGVECTYEEFKLKEGL